MGFNEAQLKRALGGSENHTRGIAVQVRTVFNRVADANRLTRPPFVELAHISGLDRDTGEDPTHDHRTGRETQRPAPQPAPIDTPEEIEQIMLDLAEEVADSEWSNRSTADNPCGCVP